MRWISGYIFFEVLRLQKVVLEMKSVRRKCRALQPKRVNPILIKFGR